MRIAHLTTTPQVGPASALIERFPMLGRIPEEQRAEGHQVALFCRSNLRGRESRRGLTLGTVAASNRLAAALALAEEVAAFSAEVVHLHGITVSSCLTASVLRARLPGLVIALQDQAFHWPPSATGRLIVHLGLSCADIAFFAVRSQAAELVRRGALRSEQVVELPGGSTDFVAVPQALARKRTGLRGDPLYLWVGRLVPVKGPLVAMKALAEVLAQRPNARLALVYGDAELHGEVMAALGGVAGQVTDLGRVPHVELPDLYSSADVFVLASERESWCSALLEAMACGATPVASAIDANLPIIGSLGRSFPVGDGAALVEALQGPRQPRAKVRRHFAEHHTFAALARQSVAAYQVALHR
jgi:glycosyltransferase involved in cell wall biosynthesis